MRNRKYEDRSRSWSKAFKAQRPDQTGPSNTNYDGDEEEDDNKDGWIDEQALMSKMEREELEESVQPVRLLLTKVSHHIKNQVGVYVIVIRKKGIYLDVLECS